MTLDRDDMTALVVLLGLVAMTAGAWMLDPRYALILVGAVLVYAGRRVV